MANEPLEVLTVQLEAEYDKLLRQTKEGVDKAERELDKLSDAPKRSQGAFEQLGGFLGGKFLGIITAVGAAIAAAFSISLLTNFFSAISRGMIDTNKQFETFETQFTTLLGSQSEAKKRIDELARFGVATPFELSEIVEANRLLQTFGGTALATGENLRRIGDSAAAVNASFQEVSFWTGRLFAAIQAGRPFGEASARLMELGILSGEVRTKLEDMQKAGASGAEIWAAYAEMVDTRFSGAMDRLSKTLQGVMSNLQDFQDMLLREGGKELFEGVREDVIEFYDIISNPEAQEALLKLSKALGSVIDAIRESVTGPILEQLEAIEPETVEGLAQSLEGLGTSLGNLLDINVGNLNDMIQAIDGAVQGIAAFIDTFNKVRDATGLAALNDAWVDLNQTILSTPLYIIDELGDALEELDKKRQANRTLASDLLGGFDTSGDAVSEAALQTASSLDAMGFSAEGVAENMRGAARATEEAAEDFTQAREKFESLSQTFLDAQDAINEKRTELEQDHGERVADIVENYGERVADLEEDIAERREEILEDSVEALADLEEEIAERREEIAENTAKALEQLERDTAEARADAIASANEDLADLEEDTRNSVAKVQEEAREEERRETEDHQREMRRLQQNYLLNLEDAVKNRDARAIVDLRRKYQQEKREREEDFEVQRSRSREEAEKRVEEAREAEDKRRREIEARLEEQLKDIEENEAEKRAKIEASQQEQLEELAELEEQKREEIATSQAEQLEKLAEFEAEKRAEIEESLAEQLAAEQESYEERQAALDEALQKRLEAVAKELADEKDITEEGAEAILETLNEYYGIGGKMDQIMEGYRERQRAQQAATASFNANLEGGSTTGGGGFETGDTGGGNFPQQLPTFQQGGIVPGQPGQKRLIIAHAGELILPVNESARLLSQGDSMAQNFSGGEMNLNLKISGSAPPGIKGPEVEQMAGMLVQALNEAGIRTRRG